jgi:GT2 family glycosyltransferase
MADISIIIVNYNVKHFLDQCLRSVETAKEGMDIETWVVDNDSIDGSVDHVRTHFPDVKLIANTQNVGFAKANNQAIRKSAGKYVLLLNPDTIIEQQTLKHCYNFMEAAAECGALGVKMIDGEGKFLPESKRGFPTPFTSLMRLTGLSRLFPGSRVFNRYNLGYLSEDETHEIDVLCGAFMFIRKDVLDKVGLLDEDFFMYGEDIDLSYRIQTAGHKIFYLPETTIIHFKGESTKKSSLKYYSTFYRAMAIFATKHYGGKRINPFLWLINTAILLIAVFDFVVKNTMRILLPVVEFIVFYGTLELVEFLWAKYHFNDVYYYKAFNSLPIYLLYSLLWLFSLWISGAYRSNFNVKRLFWGVLGGTVTMLILYALMDDSMRHSRAIILLSSGAILMMSFLIRFVVFNLIGGTFKKNQPDISRVVIVGNERDIERAAEIMHSGKNKRKELIGAIDPVTSDHPGKEYLQSIVKLPQVIDVYKIDEVLFSPESVPMREIMHWMTKLGSKVKIKILSNDVQSIIGSHDRNSRGDLYTVEMKYNITLPYNKFFKTVMDYLLAILLLGLSPLIAIFSGSLTVFYNCLSVIFRRKTWVAYIERDKALVSLPEILPGITTPVDHSTLSSLSQEEMHSINFYYARDYSISGELGIILLNLRHLAGLSKNS